ncbi:MAG: hypothetical protein JSW55_13735 [Chloroflexota bacterium]|nr:MAG: hypothetical protein JSW55_13735 [Chloroflexota bacterium]
MLTALSGRPRNRLVFGLLLLLALATSLRPLLAFQDDQPEPPDTSWRFGVVESYESPSHAARLGVGWTRVPFHWAKVQPEGSGDWEPEISQEQLESEIAAGRMAIGLLIGIPEWALAEDGLPEGLWLDHNDPANTWAGYVRRAASTYAGLIDHWVVWNEPDIQETEIAHTWDGTVADFAQLQRVAYLAAKEANPAAVIHLPAFTYWADYYAETEQYMARLLDEIMRDPEAADYNHYFDVATAHLYFQPGQIYELLGFFSDIMRERGLTQPIWLAETNAPLKDDPDWPVEDWTLSVTQVEQASFMPQALALGLAAGAERIAVYKLKDTEGDKAANPEPFGLVRLDGSERMAFATFRLAVDYLDGSVRAERERWDEIGQIRVDQIRNDGKGQSTTVVFSRLPEWLQAEVPATAELATLVNMWGTKKVITPTNGLYTIDLAPASCSHSIGDYCMIGGYTSYLVQEAEIELPIATPTPAASLVLTQTPAPVETPSRADLPSPTETSPPAESPATLPTPGPEPSPSSTRPATASATATVETLVEAASTSTPAVQSSVPSSATPPAEEEPAGATFLLLIAASGAITLVLAVAWLTQRHRS